MSRNHRRLVSIIGAMTVGICVTAGEVRIPVGAGMGGVMLVEPVQSIKELREAGIVFQQLDYSCGSAALATLLTSYLNQAYSEQYIINFILRTGDARKIMIRKGFSLLDLKRFAEAHGISAFGYALDYQSLLELHCPVLVPLSRKDLDMRHFVVFRGANADRVFLADPAIGRRTMTIAEFCREWEPQVGMVFSVPGPPPPAQHDLAVNAQDAIYLNGENIRSLVQQSVLRYIHDAKSF